MYVRSDGIVRVGLAVLLACTLAACGGGTEQQGSDQGAGQVAEEEQSAPEASVGIDPSEIEPGEGEGDSWVPLYDNNSSYESLHFNRGANEAGLVPIFVDAQGNEDNVFYAKVEDGHLVNIAEQQGDEPTIDIVFTDRFTCYDAASDTWWSRGVQADYEGLFAGKTFSQELSGGHDDILSFGEDGTYVEDWGIDNHEEGTWAVVSRTRLVMYPDGATGNGHKLDFEVSGKGELVFSDTNYVELESE